MMSRLSRFLDIDPNKFIKNEKSMILLPKPPASNSYVDWEPAYLDCKTFDKLDKYFNKTNAGLINFINNASNKPKEEPTFEAFTTSRGKCK